MRKTWVAPVLIIFLMVFNTAASAQEPTPEPTVTPTPSYQQAITMSTGSSLLVVKSITYGDIATTTAVLLLLVVELLKGMVAIPKDWFKK